MRVTGSITVLIAALLFASCDITFSTLINGPQAPVLDATLTNISANGSEYDFTGAVGADPVDIDGSNSYDPDGQPFVIEWSLEVPTSSGSVLSVLNNGYIAEFYPDLPAETYTLTATLSDGSKSATYTYIINTP